MTHVSRLRTYASASEAALAAELRKSKGLTMATFVTDWGEGRYTVPSQADQTKHYDVDLKRETCTCPDYESLNSQRRAEERPTRCKHIWAAVFAARAT